MDFHIHSSASDGRLDPADVLERAVANGVRTLALTDHDTLDGYRRVVDEAGRRGIRLVPGVELSVLWGTRTLHIVGLDFDPECPGLAAVLHRNQQARHERAERMAHRLARAGIPEALAGAGRIAAGAPPGRVHFARYLVELGAVQTTADAFKRYLARGRSAAVAGHWISLAEGVSALRDAGGIAVFAHPQRYGFTRTRCREATAAFSEAGGEALEVVCGGDGPGDRGSSAALARRFGLLASVGSDFHDPDFPWRDIGRLTPPPVDSAPVWRRFARPVDV